MFFASIFSGSVFHNKSDSLCNHALIEQLRGNSLALIRTCLAEQIDKFGKIMFSVNFDKGFPDISDVPKPAL